MPDRPYRAHAALTAPARAYPQLWRVVAGLIVITVTLYVLGSVLNTVLSIVSPGLSREMQGDAGGAGAGNTPRSLIVLLYSFGLVGVGTVLAARLLHDRGLASLIGPLPLAVRQFWTVFRVLVVLGMALALLPPYDTGEGLRRNLEFSTWALLLPFSFSAVLVQTASEELLFRGYLQQSLAARFRHPAIWIGVPSLLFGLGHYDPGLAGGNAGLIALWAVIFGVLAADLTARSGTLGPAIALHMFNNTMAILLISVPDTLSGLSLAVMPDSMSDTEGMRSWLAVDFAMMLVCWLAARLALRR